MKTILVVIALFSATYLSAQNDNRLQKELRERNNISEKLTYKYNIETNDSTLVNHDFFDSKGNRLKDLRYNEEGKIRFKYIIEYKNGLMSKQVGYDQPDIISTILVYQYDKQGNRILYQQLKPDGTILISQKREYNRKGLNTKLYNRKPYSSDYYLSQKYSYRKDGQYEKVKVYNPSGQLVDTSEYEYDDNGNLMSIYEVVPQSRKLRIAYNYNSQNQKIEKLYPRTIESRVSGRLKTGENNKRIEYEYDINGNVVEERTFENGELALKRKFFFKVN